MYFESIENRMARENPNTNSEYSDILATFSPISGPQISCLVRYRRSSMTDWVNILDLFPTRKIYRFLNIIFVLFWMADMQYSTIQIHTCVAHLMILKNVFELNTENCRGTHADALRIEPKQPREYWMIYRGPGFLAIV